MSNSVVFKAGWFTMSRVNSILYASQMTKGPGGSDRIRITNMLQELAEKQKNSSTTYLENEIELDKSSIKRWAIGVIEAWKATGQNGQLLLSDRECKILMDSAKALRCWGMVEKELPTIEADESFEVDSEIEDEEFVGDDADD